MSLKNCKDCKWFWWSKGDFDCPNCPNCAYKKHKSRDTLKSRGSQQLQRPDGRKEQFRT